MTKRIRKTAEEQDAYSKWGRRYLIYLGRAGVRKGIKRRTHRRERHDAKAAVEEQLDPYDLPPFNNHAGW